MINQLLLTMQKREAKPEILEEMAQNEEEPEIKESHLKKKIRKINK